MKPWCVQWWEKQQDGTVSTGWCATFRNQKPDPDALFDRTACNHQVTMRIGSGRRMPTCIECKQRIKRRRT